MTTDSTTGAPTNCSSQVTPRGTHSGLVQTCAALGLGLCVFFAGCQTPNSTALTPDAQTNKVPEVQTIREGDVIKIAFPGAPNLDATQAVRRDGRISLSVVGEVKAAGLTPSELEKQLVELFSSQLNEKEVNVTVVSSSFAVFVTGAVMHPGKIVADHPLTILEAIMEAGGFDVTKANPKAVVILRIEDGKTKRFTVNVKEIIDGVQTAPIYLKPTDSVIVPERFTMFN